MNDIDIVKSMVSLIRERRRHNFSMISLRKAKHYYDLVLKRRDDPKYDIVIIDYMNKL
jgi:hypothetical protein